LLIQKVLKLEGFRLQEGAWQIVTDDDGSLVLDLNNVSTCCLSEAAFGSTRWTDYEISYRVKLVSFDPKSGTPGARGVDLYFRKERGTFLGPSYILTLTTNNLASLVYYPGGENASWQTIVGYSYPFGAGTWYSVRVQVRGSRIQGYVDDNLIIDKTDSRVKAGSLGLVVERMTHARFDDIRVVALGDQ
jgi:hypothetical protein